MLNIKNSLYVKSISLAVAITFSITGIAYGVEPSHITNVRFPVGMSNDRLGEMLIREALLKDMRELVNLDRERQDLTTEFSSMKEQFLTEVDNIRYKGSEIKKQFSKLTPRIESSQRIMLTSLLGRLNSEYNNLQGLSPSNVQEIRKAINTIDDLIERLAGDMNYIVRSLKGYDTEYIRNIQKNIQGMRLKNGSIREVMQVVDKLERCNKEFDKIYEGTKVMISVKKNRDIFLELTEKDKRLSFYHSKGFDDIGEIMELYHIAVGDDRHKIVGLLELDIKDTEDAFGKLGITTVEKKYKVVNAIRGLLVSSIYMTINYHRAKGIVEDALSSEQDKIYARVYIEDANRLYERFVHKYNLPNVPYEDHVKIIDVAYDSETICHIIWYLAYLIKNNIEIPEKIGEMDLTDDEDDGDIEIPVGMYRAWDEMFRRAERLDNEREVFMTSDTMEEDIPYSEMKSGQILDMLNEWKKNISPVYTAI